jgi:hypothetical protein
MEEARVRFEQWRQARQAKAAIPEEALFFALSGESGGDFVGFSAAIG